MSRIVAVAPVLPARSYGQGEITAALLGMITDDPARQAVMRRIHAASGVESRSLIMPLEWYRSLASFREANDFFIAEGASLAARAVTQALETAGLTATDVDYLLFTSVTGIAAPSIDAQLVQRLGMRSDIKRLPSFGLGCVAGASGLARVNDYLAGHPEEIAVLLSVELCSLTVQARDDSMANIVASGLFGDGAAAVVVAGDRRAARLGLPGPEIVDTRSRIYPDTADVIGWDIGGTGFRIVLSAGVPEVIDRHFADDARGLLAAHGLTERCRRVGRASRRTENPGGVLTGSRPARRRARSHGSATCRRQRCCTSSRSSWTPTRRARSGCCSPSVRGSRVSWCCCAGRRGTPPGRAAPGSPRAGQPHDRGGAMIAYCLLILATGAERLAELVVSARNARWSFARGGVEFGRRHFPPMVALHTGLLLACFAEAWFLDRPFLPWLGWPMLALVLASQSLRWWCIAALGPRWNTRVIVIHDLPLVARGPYRWLKHPNYLAVVVEGFALPLVHSAWITALAFTALNAVLLAGYRIPCENSALADVVRGTTVSDAGLIVVGGGPVGLACAIEARLLGMDVLVVEPRSAPIDKACGEGLMPGSLAALHRLGVDPPGRTLAGIAYLDAASRAEHRFKERPGRGVRRTALHSALAARAAELGTHTLHDRVTGVTSASSGTMLTLGRERSTLSAPWVIAADGLHSPLRRLLELGGRPQPESRRRFGVRRHYTVEPWTDLVEVHWSPTAEVYVTPVDDRTIGVAVLGPRPLDQEAIISTVPALAAHLDGAPPASDPRGAGPLLQRSRTRTSGRVLLVGDASGYVDALTGEGMRVGFAQARAAVAAIRSGDSRQYERAWRTSTKDFRTLTTGLVIAARSRLRPRIVPTAAARPALFGAIVERLSQ